MENYLKELWAFLETREKQHLIHRSGSTKKDKNEKIRSGQSYLYNRRGMESEVIEVRFNDAVWGSHLNRALDKAIKRYPYLNTRLIEKDGDFYIVQNDAAPIAKKTNRLARLGGMSCNYHLIDVTFYGRSLFVSFHHALCDGRGIKPFAESLVWYYCKFRYGEKQKVEGVRLEKDKLLEGETLDPCLHPYEYDGGKSFIQLSREAYHLEENKKTENDTDTRFELKIPHGGFMAACKRYGATPVILVALFMSKAIAEIYPDYNKPINANIATDMREALGCPNTYKNCVKSMILPYDRDFSALPLKEQAKKYREILSAQRDRDYCRREANAMLALFDKLDGLNSYEDKQKVMTFFEGMTLDTYIISYLGSFILGENAKHIDGIHLYNSGTTGLGITMTATDDVFTLNFKQSFADDKYVSAFCRQLETFKIEYDSSGAIAFLTPEDDLMKRKKEGNRNAT